MLAGLLFLQFYLVCVYFIDTELLICGYLYCVIVSLGSSWGRDDSKHPQATLGELTLWKWPWGEQADLTDCLPGERERGRERDGERFKIFKTKNA